MDVAIIPFLSNPIFLVLIPMFLLYILSKRSLKQFPPGPFQWPLIGCLPQLVMHGKDPLKYHTSLVKTYGKLFSLKTGGYQSVVIADRELMKEAMVEKAACFTKRFGNIPAFNVYSKGRNLGITFGEGNLWKQSRRFIATALRNKGTGKKSLEEKIQLEAQYLVENLMEHSGKKIEPQSMISMAIFNVIASICFGTRYDYKHPWFVELIRCTSHMTQHSAFSLDSLFPIFNYLPLTPALRRYRNSRVKLEDHLNEEIENHRKTFIPGSIRDLVDLYLDNEHVQDRNNVYSKDNLQQILIDIMTAGGATTAVQLDWILLLLALNQRAQQRCFTEIEQVLGGDGPISIEDKEKLPYTEAAILECMRIGPSAPTSLPHEAEYDTELGGYTIPKGTVVHLLLHRVLMDEEFWGDPAAFRPERFLSPSGTAIEASKRDMVIIFGIGPRICPGEQLAKMEMFLFVTAIIRRFIVTLPDEYKPFNLAPVINFTSTPQPHKLEFTLR